MTPLNVFVTENNVDIFLSRLHNTFDPVERDNLMRLVAKEEDRMGLSREHVDCGERRVLDGRQRVEKQRTLVAELSATKRQADSATLLLEPLEMTQKLLEEHLTKLRGRLEQSKL